MKKYVPYIQFMLIISVILASYVQSEFIYIFLIASISSYLNNELYIRVYEPRATSHKFSIRNIIYLIILTILIQLSIFIKYN